VRYSKVESVPDSCRGVRADGPRSNSDSHVQRPTGTPARVVLPRDCRGMLWPRIVLDSLSSRGSHTAEVLRGPGVRERLLLEGIVEPVSRVDPDATKAEPPLRRRMLRIFADRCSEG
jgi:hypothetical protein